MEINKAKKLTEITDEIKKLCKVNKKECNNI